MRATALRAVEADRELDVDDAFLGAALRAVVDFLAVCAFFKFANAVVLLVAVEPVEREDNAFLGAALRAVVDVVDFLAAVEERLVEDAAFLGAALRAVVVFLAAVERDAVERLVVFLAADVFEEDVDFFAAAGLRAGALRAAVFVVAISLFLLNSLRLDALMTDNR